jgi:hypothetical protein
VWFTDSDATLAKIKAVSNFSAVTWWGGRRTWPRQQGLWP